MRAQISRLSSYANWAYKYTLDKLTFERDQLHIQPSSQRDQEEKEFFFSKDRSHIFFAHTMEAALKSYGINTARLQTLDILSFNRKELGVAVVAIGERWIACARARANVREVWLRMLRALPLASPFVGTNTPPALPRPTQRMMDVWQLIRQLYDNTTPANQ